MKVLLINGSPNKNGCTHAALSIIADELRRQGINGETVWIGKDPISGCTGCGRCKILGKCICKSDTINAIGEKIKNADGYIFGAPVHYASPNGSMIAAMDRLFMAFGKYMQFKPAACIVSARRAGTTASYDVLNKYIGVNNIITVPSTYWNMIHGTNAQEALKDDEGICIMRAVGSNMAWLLKVLESVQGTQIEKPIIIPKVKTNFIR